MTFPNEAYFGAVGPKVSYMGKCHLFPLGGGEVTQIWEKRNLLRPPFRGVLSI
jgi:hypothetical protein